MKNTKPGFNKHAEIEYIGQAWHISVQIYKNSKLNSAAILGMV